jgi:hypothetical protein
MGRWVHTYTLPVVKLLFATARTCAYPACATPLIFIDQDRGVREVAVQIAHIRSPKADGPSYDPAFPSDQLNSDGNLMLLCGVHHHPVDRNGSKYTTEELLRWKQAQTAEGGGFTVQDCDIADLVTRLEASLGELVRATRLQLQVRLVGGRLAPFAGSPVARIDLEGMEEYGRRGAHLFRPGRLVGGGSGEPGACGRRGAGSRHRYRSWAGPPPSLEICIRPEQHHDLAVPLPG